jgi:hypothetical protein
MELHTYEIVPNEFHLHERHLFSFILIIVPYHLFLYCVLLHLFLKLLLMLTF